LDCDLVDEVRYCYDEYGMACRRKRWPTLVGDGNFMPEGSGARVKMDANPATGRWLAGLTGRHDDSYTPNQWMWIASQPALLEAPLGAQQEIHEFLMSKGWGAFLPLDTKKRIEWNIRNATANGRFYPTLQF
jgi:hypothetical protein